jgi:Fe-S cluster biogenesis protein NfuA
MLRVTIDAAAVEQALDEIRPHLHGGIELVAVEGDVVRVRMHGECADCTLQQVTLRTGVERVVRARVPSVSAVEAV